MCTSEVTLKGVKSSSQNYSYEYSVFLNYSLRAYVTQAQKKVHQNLWFEGI